MKPPLYILDGYSLIYRSYFAFIRNPLFNPQGRNSSAVFGFFRTLFGFFDRYDPDYFVVALDSLTPTFRHEKYPEYKATRDKTPQDLHDQVPVVEEILDRFLPPGAVCCVVAVPDERRGSRIAAVVTCDVDERTVMQRMATELPRMAVPKTFVRVDEIPMLGSSKVDFRAAQRLAAASMSGGA